MWSRMSVGGWCVGVNMARDVECASSRLQSGEVDSLALVFSDLNYFGEGFSCRHPY